MNATEFLALIGRNEIEKLGSGEKTGEYLITPAELESYAAQQKEAWQREAFEAGAKLFACDVFTSMTLNREYNDWKEATQ